MPRYRVTNHMAPGVTFMTADGPVHTDHNGECIMSEEQAAHLANSNDVVALDKPAPKAAPKRATKSA